MFLKSTFIYKPFFSINRIASGLYSNTSAEILIIASFSFNFSIKKLKITLPNPSLVQSFNKDIPIFAL